MKDMDLCTSVSRAQAGSIAGRPMSNNREVEYVGTRRFRTNDDTRMTEDIARDPSVGLTYQGKAGLKGLVGAPGLFVHVEGEAALVRDKARFAQHWDKNLDRWFAQGIDTPGLVMIEVAA